MQGRIELRVSARLDGDRLQGRYYRRDETLSDRAVAVLDCTRGGSFTTRVKGMSLP